MAFGVGLQEKRKSGVSATPFRVALSLSSARRYSPARFHATGGRFVSRFTMLAELWKKMAYFFQSLLSQSSRGLFTDGFL